MDYEADIEIDEQALDVEWLDQSGRMFDYCRHAASTQMDMDLAKERLDVVRAELDQRVRADPEQYGLELRSTKDGKPQPPTEGAILSTVMTQTEYQEATQDYLRKKFEYGVAQGAVRAFDQRKSALENLVRLHGQSYFAGPSVPHDLSEIRRQRDERRRERDADVQRRVRLKRRQ